MYGLADGSILQTSSNQCCFNNRSSGEVVRLQSVKRKPVSSWETPAADAGEGRSEP